MSDHGMEELSQVMRHRREKLAALRERGIEPFAYAFDANSFTILRLE